MIKNKIWVEKYIPSSFEEVILPSQLKKIFKGFIDNKHFPNLLLCGPAGVGKTTIAKVLCNALDYDFFLVEGSFIHRGIDALRNDVLSFISAISLTGNHKCVIFDEADNLTHDAQMALRNFIQKYSSFSSFILTANYPQKLLPELHSRCSVIEFIVPKDEKPFVARDFFKIATSILTKENIPFDKTVVAEFVLLHFPDFRRTLNELEKYAATGAINSGIFSQPLKIDELINAVKKKDFTEARKWVTENLDNSEKLYRQLYDTSETKINASAIPALIQLIAKYQYQDVFVADKEINFMGFIGEVMINGIYD
jgi:DNA polymerase III delta prime subunit